MKPMKLDIQMFAPDVGTISINLYFKDIAESELPESLIFSFDGEQVTIPISGVSMNYVWNYWGSHTFNSITILSEGYLIIPYQVGNGIVDIDIYKNFSFVKKILEDNTINQTTPDFSQVATTDEGMFADFDNEGVTTYFRGAVTNNYVKFANFWWRIIRVNGNGSIRLIYDGTTAHANGESSTDRQIDTSAFNTNSNDNAYVGYMYGTPGSSTHEATHANINNSAIKTILDSWYESNLSNHSDYIDTEAGFCGDRTPYSGSGTGTTRTYYAPYNRLFTNKTPSFECTNNSDLYTTTGSEDGNKALQYPIGLISTDEVAYAGGVYNTSNSSYYLCIRNVYWTMSPSSYNSGAGVFCVGSNGRLGWYGVRSAVGVRPVINLRGDLFVTGTGTSTDPYEVSLSVVPATIFNGTELTNIYYNGTEISKMYCNGVLVFEKGPSVVYKRRIMVGDDLKGMTVYNDFYSGYYNNFTKPTGGAIVLPMKLVTVNYETTGMAGDLSGISYYEGSGTITINSDFLEAELYYYNWNTGVERIGGTLTYPTDKDYLVTEVYDIDKSYRHLYIEDPNIRPLQVGDVITSNTKFYFTFPDDFSKKVSPQMMAIISAKYSDNSSAMNLWYSKIASTNNVYFNFYGMSGYSQENVYSTNSSGDVTTNISYKNLAVTSPITISAINNTDIAKYVLVDTTTLGA